MAWWAAFLVAAAASAAAGQGRSTGGGGDDSIEVVVRGTLHTGIMAIGGETTGTTVSARGVTWELDLGSRPELAARADSLNGRRVVVAGTLEARAGVERRQRFIVTVKTLAAAGSAPRASP